MRLFLLSFLILFFSGALYIKSGDFSTIQDTANQTMPLLSEPLTLNMKKKLKNILSAEDIENYAGCWAGSLFSMAELGTWMTSYVWYPAAMSVAPACGGAAITGAVVGPFLAAGGSYYALKRYMSAHNETS